MFHHVIYSYVSYLIRQPRVSKGDKVERDSHYSLPTCLPTVQSSSISTRRLNLPRQGGAARQQVIWGNSCGPGIFRFFAAVRQLSLSCIGTKIRTPHFPHISTSKPRTIVASACRTPSRPSARRVAQLLTPPGELLKDVGTRIIPNT